MKQVETLLNIEFGQKFATPKKLNRSTKNIPENVLQQLEDGLFTAEMINELAATFPIFHYRSCITIHGSWNDINRTHIGYYKNVHQNKNGSVEIYYSAIDRQKIITIRENLKQVANVGWYFIENSTDRVFRLSESITKETLTDLKIKYTAIAQRVKEANIYGFANLYIQPTLWGGHYITLDIHPLAIPEAEIWNFCHKLTGLNVDQWKHTAAEVTKQKLISEAENKAASEAAATERANRQAAQIALLNATYKPQIAHLQDGSIQDGTIVKLAEKWNSEASKYEGFIFNYFRIDGKGSFGKTKWSKATSEVFTADLTTLEFLPQTERKAAELKQVGKLVAATCKVPVIETKKPLQPITPAAGIEVIQYSDKAIALFGNTKPIKDTLKQLGGRFNPFLTKDGTKQPGWIFTNDKRNQLQTLIS